MPKTAFQSQDIWGTIENAVRFQIAVAFITPYLVAMVHHDMNLESSTYEVLQISSMSTSGQGSLNSPVR